MANTTTVAAKIAALVRKHAPAGAKIEALDKEVAEIAAAAIAAATGHPLDAAAAVTVEWFKLANRAEIKLSAETTMQLTMALAQARGRRVVLVFASPDTVAGELPVSRPVADEAQLDLENAVAEQKAAEKPADRPVADQQKGAGAAPQTMAQQDPLELPEWLRRSRKKAEPKAEPAKADPVAQQAEATRPEPWVPSVDEPEGYDPDQSPGVNA